MSSSAPSALVTLTGEGDTWSFLSDSDASGSRSPTSNAGRHRRRPERRRRLGTTAVAALSLLLSAGAVALIVWYSREADARLLELDRLIGALRRASADASGRIGRLEEAIPEAATAKVAVAGAVAASEYRTRDGSGDAASVTGMASEAATPVSATAATPATSARDGLVLECRAQTVTCDNVAYPSGCFVTKWQHDQGQDREACAGNDGAIEIRTAGYYYVYSQALLSGPNDKGVVIVAVQHERPSTNRSVLAKHGLCLIDRQTSQPRELKSASFVAMDQLTTYVGVQVWLPSGARLKVNLTSMKGLVNRHGSEANFAWHPVTIGWFPISSKS